MTATATAAPTVDYCACCAEVEIGPKSTFAQGHDARLVSQALKFAKAAEFEAEAVQSARTEIAKFSMALVQKFEKAVVNAQTPRVRKAKAAPAATRTVKIGRWTYEGKVVKTASGQEMVEVTKKNGEVVRVAA